MESPTSYQVQEVFSMGSASQSIKEKLNYTKWSLWEQTMVLLWMVVVLVPLGGVVSLGCKDLAPLKFQAPQTF